MKKFFYLLCCLFGTVCILMAQAPQAFHYQAVIRNKAGDLLKSQQLELQISILENSPQGTTIYQETHSVKSSNAGTISLQVGKGMPIQGKFENINWGSGKEYYIHTVFTLNHETIDLGAVQILSVPYALYAQHSGEKHDLVLDGDSLRIKGGGKAVLLPKSTTEGGNTGSCLWEKEGLATASYTGSISLKTSDNIEYLKAYADLESGHLQLNSNGDNRTFFHPGKIELCSNNGQSDWVFDEKDKYFRITNTQNGVTLSPTHLSLYNNKYISALLGTSASGSGFLNLCDKPEQGKITASLTANEYGDLKLYNKTGTKTNIHLGVVKNSSNNVGWIGTFDSNGDYLISLSTLYQNGQSYHQNAAFGLHYQGELAALFFVDTDGRSKLSVDEVFIGGQSLRSSTTNYTVDNLRSSSTYAPCFVSESTDQQITFRGTATLDNGTFTIVLPPNEAEKIQENTITVQITPLSASSKGLAVVKKEKTSFTVAELMNGTGSYDFDWTLTALRKENPQLRSSHSIGAAGAAPIQNERNIPTTSK